MKSRILFITLIGSAFVLSSCYTQLQYSQRMHGITDERPYTPGYSWSDEGEYTEADSNYVEGYEEGYSDALEDYPYYYKDYAAADWYSRHGWRFSLGFHFGFHDWYYPYGGFASFHYGSPFGYPWYYSHWNRHYYGYGPGYYYWPGYFNYSTFVYAGYKGNIDRDDDERRFGRRTTIGTNRINAGRTDRARISNTRSRSRDHAVTSGRRTTSVRSRSTVEQRSRTVRSRSGSDGRSQVRSTGRSRSSGSGTRVDRDTNRRKRSDDYRSSVNRGGDDRRSVRVNRQNLTGNNDIEIRRAVIESRIRQRKAPDIDMDRINRKQPGSRFFRVKRTNSNHFRFNPVKTRSKIHFNHSSSNSRSRVKSISRSSSSRSRSSGTSSSSSKSSSSRRSRGGN